MKNPPSSVFSPEDRSEDRSEDGTEDGTEDGGSFEGGGVFFEDGRVLRYSGSE